MRAIALVVLAGCGTDPLPLVSATMTREPGLDTIFHSEPRWLGGDGAYAIDLGNERTLWLFGDSFIATSPALVRSQSTMVRNSVGIMTGRDLATATMQFAWHDGTPPTSFFPEVGGHWFWPTDGVRTPDGAVVIFLSEVRATPGEGLGFASAGYHAVRIADPSGPPLGWTIESLPFSAPTGSIACVAVDGDELVAVREDGSVGRWPLDAIATANTTWHYADGPPEASECSIHHDSAWIFVRSRGFGDTTIAMATAQTPEGPWTDEVDLLRPPESMVDNAFVYAAKAHPFLTHDGAIVTTFADNSFTFNDLFTKQDTLYWPHVALMRVQP